MGGLLVAATPAAHADDPSCGTGECGVPDCWTERTYRVRPDHDRSFRLYCARTTSVELAEPPAHGQVKDVTLSWDGVHFTVRPHSTSSGADRFVLRVHGPSRTVDVPVDLDVIPLSINHAPVCYGDQITQRSDGRSAVTLHPRPWCVDSEGDEFTMEGGGPGRHPGSPAAVGANGCCPSDWTYIPATLSGTETTKVWATDYLGLRSADVEEKVTIGPGIDRLPWCHPSGGWWGDPAHVQEIFMRPGVRRHFGMRCEDADGDLFAPTLADPPDRGAIAEFVPQPFDPFGIWGGEMYVDVTYVPQDASTEPVQFTVTATGARGTGPNARTQLTPRTMPANGYGGCGWYSLGVPPDVPGTLNLRCDDTDGDALSAEVVDGPSHGTVGPPAVLEGLYGVQTIAIPYVPDPGHLGYDCVKVRISDGHGWMTETVVDIDVDERYRPAPDIPRLPVPLPDLPPIPVPLPGTPTSLPGLPGLPGGGAAPSPASLRAEAQDALMTLKVRRLDLDLPVEVWAPAKLSRGRMLAQGRVPSFFVACPKGCTARSLARLLAGKSRRAVLAGRHGSFVEASPGHAATIWLDLARGERRALRVGRHAEAAFTLGVRVAGSPRKTLRPRLRIGR